MTTKKQQQLNDQRINRAFSTHLNGLAVPIQNLDRICRAGEIVLLAGGSDEQIGLAMLAEAKRDL